MRRIICGFAVLAMFATVASLQAQPGPRGPGGKGRGPGEPPAKSPAGSSEVQKLQAELDKLQHAIKDVEARLKKAKESSARGPGGFGPPGGFPNFPGMGGRFPGSPGGSGFPGFPGPKGTASGSGDVNKRLDKVEKDLEEIKRLLGSRGKR